MPIHFAKSPPRACRDIRGIVHCEFVPTGQTVNQVYYLEVLKRLREKVRRKRPEIFANNSCILHHDNAPAYTTLSVREFIATEQITVGTPCLFTGSHLCSHLRLNVAQKDNFNYMISHLIKRKLSRVMAVRI